MPENIAINTDNIFLKFSKWTCFAAAAIAAVNVGVYIFRIEEQVPKFLLNSALTLLLALVALALFFSLASGIRYGSMSSLFTRRSIPTTKKDPVQFWIHFSLDLTAMLGVMYLIAFVP